MRRKVALASLIDEAAASAIPEDSGIRFENRVPKTLEVEADSEQLFRVTLNLLRNAREAVAATDRSEKSIQVEAKGRGERIVIDIVDNGPGIPLKVRERLFQPFAGSQRQGGSGLGLAISRELIQAHGGEIVLVSTDSTGTRFRITLPQRVKTKV